MSFRKNLLGHSGFSLVEGLLAAGMLGATALGFAELSKNSVNVTQTLESRYTKIDVEQSIRQAFMNDLSCKCAFAGTTITTGNSANMSNILFTDPACDNPRTIITAGQNVQNSTLKVENISVRNITTFTPNELIGDLVVNWKNSGKGLPIKASMMKNLRFNIDGTGAVLGCGFAPQNIEPTECGNGKICIDGKQIQFFNDPVFSAPLSASSQGLDSDGWLGVKLQAPSGRHTLIKLKEISGVLKYMVPHGNWRPQLCWYHMLANPCHVFPDIGFNCGSAIHWKYYRNGNTPQDGNTGNGSLRETNPSPGSPEKPFTSC